MSDLKELYAPAYREDRTRGSNAIWRPLDNLQDAGLIYCNIIYDKAPVVMDKLAEMLGDQEFQEGLREYLKKYGYSNASWDDLVDILDKHTETDLREWSDACLLIQISIHCSQRRFFRHFEWQDRNQLSRIIVRLFINCEKKFIYE